MSPGSIVYANCCSYQILVAPLLRVPHGICAASCLYHTSVLHHVLLLYHILRALYIVYTTSCLHRDCCSPHVYGVPHVVGTAFCLCLILVVFRAIRLVCMTSSVCTTFVCMPHRACTMNLFCTTHCAVPHLVPYILFAPYVCSAKRTCDAQQPRGISTVWCGMRNTLCTRWCKASMWGADADTDTDTDTTLNSDNFEKKNASSSPRFSAAPAPLQPGRRRRCSGSIRGGPLLSTRAVGQPLPQTWHLGDIQRVVAESSRGSGDLFCCFRIVLRGACVIYMYQSLGHIPPPPPQWYGPPTPPHHPHLGDDAGNAGDAVQLRSQTPPFTP